ncbi:hypothetical protein NL676_031101 [Syzygium grande]|nr:hypothetical protein NL676_031101 [Syzygium grande]
MKKYFLPENYKQDLFLNLHSLKQNEPYWSFADVCKLAYKVEKQHDTSKKPSYKPFTKEVSSSKWSSSFQTKNSTTRKDKARVDSQPMTTAKERRCFKCQGYGYVAFECPNRRTITLKEVEGTKAEEDELVWDSEEGEEYVEQPNDGELLVIRKTLNSNMVLMEEQRENIFQTRCTIKEKTSMAKQGE